MSEEEDGEREHEPTQKKLDDARKRGEVPRSPELSVAAGYLGLLIAAAALGAPALAAMVARFATLIEGADRHAADLLGGGSSLATGFLVGSLLPALPFLLVPALLVLAVLAVQRVLVFAPEKLAPRLSRIDPFANARQKFGRAGLFEFARNAVKLVVVSVLLAAFLRARLPRALVAQRYDPALVAAEALRLVVEFLLLVVLISGAIAAIDYLWQRAEFLRKNRMSRKELMDELKESEGDPHVRAQRRQRAEAIAMNRMLADVPTADVVIVNPTHYAVALRWERKSGRAPICVAKGTDSLALRIREAAMAAGVPIRSDPPTARALHAAVRIGEEVRPEHYAPVAAAIRFAEAMRQRSRGRSGR